MSGSSPVAAVSDVDIDVSGRGLFSNHGMLLQQTETRRPLSFKVDFRQNEHKADVQKNEHEALAASFDRSRSCTPQETEASAVSIGRSRSCGPAELEATCKVRSGSCRTSVEDCGSDVEGSDPMVGTESESTRERSSSCPAIKPETIRQARRKARNLKMKERACRERTSSVLSQASMKLKLPSIISTRPQKLRVAVFNACPGTTIHPAASSCLVGLTQIPWFYSKAVASLTGVSKETAGDRGRLLTRGEVVEVELLRGDDIRNGQLCAPQEKGGDSRGYNVLVVPGGSAVIDSNVLGIKGLTAIKNFVNNGGGYCGICAGAFLALTGWKHPRGQRDSLALVNAGLDKGSKPASREAYLCKICFSVAGRQWLWDEGFAQRFEPEENKDGAVKMRFHNGPHMIVPPGSKASALGTMAAIADPDSVVGSIVVEDCGGGRAVLISPHPESTHTKSMEATPGKHRLARILQRAVLLAMGGPKAHSWINDFLHVPG